MSGPAGYVDLGREGVALVQDRVDHLTWIGVWSTDGSAEPKIERRWSVDLVALLAHRIANGTVLDGGDVEIPAGLLPSQEADFVYGAKNELVWRRFLSRSESRFLVVPSEWDNRYPDRFRFDAEGVFRPFLHGEALYWLAQLPLELDGRLSVVSRASGYMCSWSPLALVGNEAFDATGDELWTAGLATHQQLEMLAASTTRVLTEGSQCGSFIVWESPAADA